MKIFIALAFLVSGCASNPLVLDKNEHFPKELPKEVFEEFNVKETPPLIKPVNSKQNKPKDTKILKNTKSSPKELNAQFNPGEKFRLKAIWKGITAAHIDFNTLPNKFIGESEVFHFKLNIKESSALKFFYKINDSIESFVDKEKLLPVRFEKTVSESKKATFDLILFNLKEKYMHFFHKTKNEELNSSENKVFYDSPYHDELSVFYFIRKFNFEKDLKSKFRYIESGGKRKEIIVTFLEKTHIDTDIGSNIAAIKLGLKIVDENHINGPEATMFLSDDEKRIILQIEAKIKIGQVYLKIENLNL